MSIIREGGSALTGDNDVPIGSSNEYKINIDQVKAMRRKEDSNKDI